MFKTLDLTDKKILSELDKNCRITTIKLAKLTRKSRQAVEYRMNKLQKRGILKGFQAAINPHKMGHKIYKIYLKLRNIPEEKHKLFNYLKNLGKVYWMGECTGRWDTIFGIFAQSDYEFFQIRNELISTFKEIILDEEEALLLDVKQYVKMYLTDEIQEPTMFAGEVIDNKLESFDYQLLEILVNDGRMSLVELSTQLNSTVSIVSTRMKQLEKKGIIIQYRIGIDLNKLGLELYKAIIKLERYTKEDEIKMLEYFSNLPQIQYYIRNLGEIELELVVSSYQEYYLLLEKIKETFPFVIRSVDSVLMITDEWTPGFKNIFEKK